MQTALESGGPATVRLCPNTTYEGVFWIDRDVTVIGEGAESSILSGSGGISVVTVRSGTVELQGVGISNGGGGRGGGLYNTGVLTLSQCRVTNNQVIHHPSEGGGVFNGGTLTLTECTIASNRSAGHGGGIYNSGISTLDGSTVSGNDASFLGGGIYNGTLSGTPRVTLRGTSLVTDNDANQGNQESGGGIYNVVPNGPAPWQPGIVEFHDSSRVTGNSPNDCTGVDCTA